MEKKKIGFIILGVCALVLSVIGVTYAFWTLNLQQTDDNNLATSCFDVELINEGDPIQLLKTYPMLDSEGETLTPYTFTLKNKCGANVKYQINLESLSEVSGESIEEQRLQSKYIKEKLNEEGKTGSINILTDNEEVTTTIDKAVESYKLETGYMVENEEKKFELRLWLRGDLTMEDEEAMNKTFASKITIVATYAKEIPKTLEETILAIEPEEEDSGNTGIYKVTHNDASITYTSNPTSIANLQKDEYRYAGSNPNNYVDVGERYVTDTYGFFYQDKYEFDTEEKCTADRSAILKSLEAGEEATECSTTPNTEGLYMLEFKFVEEDEYFITHTYSTIEECQSDRDNYEFIVTDCFQPENIYSYTETYQGGPKEYSSNEECMLDYESDIADGYGICKLFHETGNPLYWRIIGLVNTPEGQRVKLVRDTSIGDFSWDTSTSNVNNGSGINEWSESDLMKLLNPGYEKNKLEDSDGTIQLGQYANHSLYWNGGIGKCYVDDDNLASDCDFQNIKIPDSLKNMIEEVTWTIGADDGNSYSEGTVSKFYEYERSSNTGKVCDSSDSHCNDTVERTTSWKGKVGLIYPSDYGYATTGRLETRTMCLGKTEDDIAMSIWYSTSCYMDDWLSSSLNQEYWTLSPYVRNDASQAFLIESDGRVENSYVSNAYGIRPSVYLKSNVYVKQGNGSKENPYVLEG